MFIPHTGTILVTSSIYAFLFIQFPLQTSDLRLQTSDFRPLTSDFRLQTSDFIPPASYLLFP